MEALEHRQHFLKKRDYVPLIKRALKEDLGKNGDITSNAIFNRKTEAVFTLFSKDEGVLCGIEVFSAVFLYLDKKVQIESFYKDGDFLRKGNVVAKIRGPLVPILTGERSSLNFLSLLSGVATKTAQYVNAVKGKPIILDTRKTLPGMRKLQKYAVVIGGGKNHRIGLYDMILIKDNHVDAAGSITEAVRRVRKRWGKRFKIEVETRSLDEVREALASKVDRIMLDNMSNALMKEASDIVAGRSEIEASGNMTLEQLPSLTECGIDFVSFGELTHSVRNFDFSLKQEQVL